MDENYKTSHVRLIHQSEHAKTVMGCGVFVNDKHIITCAHVVSDVLDLDHYLPLQNGVEVFLECSFNRDFEPFAARVKASYPLDGSPSPTGKTFIDLCLLEVVSMPESLTDYCQSAYLRYLPSNESDFRHQSVESFGFPRNYNDIGRSQAAKLLNYNRNQWIHLYAEQQIDWIFEGGFSGAPVCDTQHGHVLGIMATASTDKTAFLIPSLHLLEAFEHLIELPVFECPYKGLEPFESADADLFFGRENDIDTLLRWVTQEERPFIGVIGPSGCGKSSLIKAGLLPRLTHYQTFMIRPGHNGF